MANVLSREKQVRIISALAEDCSIGNGPEGDGPSVDRGRPCGSGFGRIGMTYIEAIQDAIRRTHGCESRHIESVPVQETFRGQVVWSGVVEVFELTGHPKAKHCYAWGHRAGRGDNRSRYVIVLKMPPVDSPEAAVKASIASEFRG